MSKGTGTRCFVCNRPIGSKESVWAYHYMGGIATSWVGLECLFRIDGPQIAGLLDYAERYGVRAARVLIERQVQGSSTAERSEPKGSLD